MLRWVLAAATSLSVAVFTPAANAEDNGENTCRQLLQLSWSDIVRSPVPRNARNAPPSLSIPAVSVSSASVGPQMQTREETDPEPIEDPASPLLTALAEACEGEREPYLEISVLHADRQARIGDLDEAARLLGRVEPQPGDRVFARYHALWLKLRWAQVMQAQRLRQFEDASQGDVLARYIAARDDVLEVNHQRMLDAGFVAEENATIAGISLRGYRLPEEAGAGLELAEGQAPGWVLIAADLGGSIERVDAVPSPWSREGESPSLRMTTSGCSNSGAPVEEGDLRFDGTLTYEQVITVLEQHYTREGEERGLPSRPGIPGFCPNFSQMLSGLGVEYEFIGTEYRDPNAAYSETDIMLALQSEDTATRDQATDYLLDHPDLVDPYYLIYAVTNQFQRGDRERAAFWYYIWQMRTRQWMTADSSNAQFMGALRATVGPMINEWAGSDLEAWKQLYVRAIRYELELPLYEGQPDNVSRREWRRIVRRVREENSEEATLQLFEDSADMQEARRENGLYIGPWEDPGRPLKDEWR